MSIVYVYTDRVARAAAAARAFERSFRKRAHVYVSSALCNIKRDICVVYVNIIYIRAVYVCSFCIYRPVGEIY